MGCGAVEKREVFLYCLFFPEEGCCALLLAPPVENFANVAEMSGISKAGI